MITNMDKHKKFNAITNSTFHEKLPDDSAGSKHVANVYLSRICCVASCIIIL
jgi:hypothetical protein